MQHLSSLISSMKKYLLIIAMGMLAMQYAHSEDTVGADKNVRQLDYQHFALIPVQHQGRIKPLDSFARIYLKILSHSNNVGGLNAVEWLAEVILAPEVAYKRPVFKISNLQDILELPENEDKLYSFYQVSSALGKQRQLVEELRASDYEELTPKQKELVNLSHNSLAYFDISRGLSLFAPIFKIQDEQLADYLGVTAGIAFNYLDAIQFNNRLNQLIDDTLKIKQTQRQDGSSSSDPTEFTAGEIESLAVANLLSTISNDKEAFLLKVLPGQWRSEWTSPWENINRGDGSPDTAKLFSSWQKLIMSYRDGGEGWTSASKQLLDDTLALADAGQDVRLWKLEVFYNKSKLFLIGMLLYILAALVALANPLLHRVRLFTKQNIHTLTLAFIAGGLMAQIAGIVMRMIILQRPPVSNFHESLLFVMVIAVLGGFIMELINRSKYSSRHNSVSKHASGYDYGGIAVACSSGIILSLLGFYYQGQGDSMQMLIAVLNSNYWLATHVIVITLGYAAAIVISILGHIYLAKYVYHWLRFGTDTSSKWSHLYNFMLGGSLIALFLMLLGTILGGIWADQSWGRFWGWDPKENGALLIILWLILMLHSRLTKSVTPPIFAAGLVALNIVVALSWFGVNLLNVGLHSYGFIDNNALLGLFAFIGFELAYILITLTLSSAVSRRLQGLQPAGGKT